MTSSIQDTKTNLIRKSDRFQLLAIFFAASLLPTVTGCANKMAMGTSFNLSPSASTLNVPTGARASSTIQVVGQNGFSDNVALAASEVPSGVTAVFSPATTSSTSSLTFAASNAAASGNYTVTVTGTSGTLTSSTAVVLTVTDPTVTAPANFSLSSSSGSLALVAGASATSTISINDQNGFSGSVNLTASGLPSGMTAVFSPTTTSSTSSLTFAANSAVAPGKYSVTVTGNSGALSGSTTVMLTVTAATVTAPANFSLSSSSGSLALLAGANATSNISVNDQNGFSGSVNLTASGLPSGVTAAFSPAATKSTSSLTFTASNAVASVNYTVTVTGTSGTLIKTATIGLTVTAPAPTPTPTKGVSIAITQPTYGYNVLPGSVRRIYATVTSGTTNAVNWTVDGGATLSSSTGHWVDVTAPASGSSCSISGTSSSDYAVSSATQFSITAQSVENPAATSTIKVNVCKPAVVVNVVPFYTTLYSGQKADIQSFVWGASNNNVTWSLTSQPGGGDGALTDTSNLDTVFSATVAGRYTLTATSVADSTKTNTATVYVTGNPMPSYETTPSETEPVDCTVDPAMAGTVYDVGPSQAYRTIASVPWPSLAPGSTIRIHNEDTTGSNPTTYHEYFQVVGHATRTQPIRVCGVPDAEGNLPVIDANNSTGVPDASTYAIENYAAVSIGGSYVSNWSGNYTGTWTGSQDLIVEGLKIQNAKSANTHTAPDGVVGTWPAGVACVRVNPSLDTVVRGIDAYNCDNGFFSDFNANNGYAVVANTLYEGNHLHGNGVVGSYNQHQFYIQGWNEVVQFNLVDQYQPGAGGSNFKSRGFPDLIRYNHFGDGAARELDLIDNQDATSYTTFEALLASSGTVSYPADLIAATIEAHHADYVYGNTFVNSTSMVPIHYFSDMCDLDANRLGTLWFYNNSFYAGTGTLWRWFLFDTAGAGGGNCPAVEWPQIQVLNNALWMNSPSKPYFYWNHEPNQFTTFAGANAVNSNWGIGNMTGGDGTGWASANSSYGSQGSTSPYAFQGASNLADTVGVSNLIGVSTPPFDLTTFLPNSSLINAGTNPPNYWPKLPVRFQFGPAAVPVARTQPLTIGAME